MECPLSGAKKLGHYDRNWGALLSFAECFGSTDKSGNSLASGLELTQRRGDLVVGLRRNGQGNEIVVFHLDANPSAKFCN